MDRVEYKIEFTRRLVRLHKAIDNYLINGFSNDLFPSLFSVFSYLWTSSNAKKYGNKRNKK